MKINYLDLFSGAGGFHLGLTQAGFSFDWVGFSDVYKPAIETYKTHFPESEDLGDVREISTEELPPIDLISFGFPCQDVSSAGKRKGMEGERTGLFFEAMRIIRDKLPSVFIFENVKGLLEKEKDGTRPFDRCLQEIANIGLYECEWQMLNSTRFLPQNRERVFFIGHLRGKSSVKVFPIGKVGAEFKKTRKVHKNCGKTLLARDYDNWKGTFVRELTLNVPMSKRIYDPSGCSRTLSSLGGGGGANTGLYLVADKIRRLTPIECERLQGFPDNWTAGQSDCARVKMMGNAVSVPVVKAIAERLLK